MNVEFMGELPNSKANLSSVKLSADTTANIGELKLIMAKGSGAYGDRYGYNISVRLDRVFGFLLPCG